MKPKTRIIFSVVEVISDDGRHFEVNWHRDLYPVLDEITPNGELTDKIINIAEELIELESPDEAANID